MKKTLTAALAAVLLAQAAPAPLALAAAPAYANAPATAPGEVAVPIGGAADKVRELVKKGLVSLLTAFTNVGASIVTNRMIQAGTAPKNIGWGTGTTTAAVTQTALVTEAAPTTSGGRTVGTESRTTITNSNDNYQVTGTVTAGSSLAITEAGLFDATTAGNMLIRGDYSAVNVVSGDSIAYTFGLKFVPNAA